MIALAIYIDEPKYLAAGESCVVVEFADEISRAANDAVTALTKHMRSQKRVPLMECLPTYRSLAIYFDPTKTTEVVRRHSAKACHCYMIGFLPGFAYLGGMDESIATPRLANPRTVIKGGSVGIAGKQTGIYPIDSPGGWQLIGRTPLRLFTPEAERPTLIEAGYEVRFVPVSEEEYKKIEAEVASGTYKPVLKGADAQ